MKQHRLLTNGLSLFFAIPIYSGLAHEALKQPEILPEVECYERGLVARSLEAITEIFTDRWKQIRDEAKIFEKEPGIWGLGGWGKWVIDSEKAQNLFRQAAKDPWKNFYKIFYNPRNLNTREAQKISKILAHEAVFRRYYNALCQKIIVDYPYIYQDSPPGQSESYENILEFQLIMVLESLIYDTQQELLARLEKYRVQLALPVSSQLIDRLRQNPLKDNFHNTFKLQYEAIRQTGSLGQYMRKRQKSEQETLKKIEHRKQELLNAQKQKQLEEERLEQERSKNIPIPPPPPPLQPSPKISFKEKKNYLLKSLNRPQYSEQEIPRVKLKPLEQSPPSETLLLPNLAPKKRIILPPNTVTLPAELLNDITAKKIKLKPANERVLEALSPQQPSNDYFNFFNQIMLARRKTIEGDSADNQEEDDSED